MSKPTNQQREGWSERFDDRFNGWIIQDSQESYRSFETVKTFIKETLENELHERDKDWQKTIKWVATLERERVLNEVKSSAAEQRCRDCDERNDQCVVNSALDCVIEVITSLQENK